MNKKNKTVSNIKQMQLASVMLSKLKIQIDQAIIKLRNNLAEIPDIKIRKEIIKQIKKQLKETVKEIKKQNKGKFDARLEKKVIDYIEKKIQQIEKELIGEIKQNKRRKTKKARK